MLGRTYTAALISSMIFPLASTAEAATLSFTATATLSSGVAYPWYPAQIQGVIDFAPVASSSEASGAGMAHYGAGTMTLTYLGNTPYGGDGSSDVLSVNLYAQQDYASSGQVHDVISIGSASAPSNSIYGATSFTLNLFGDTNLLNGETFADTVSVLTSPASLASLVQTGIFAPTAYINAAYLYSSVIYGNVSLVSSVPEPETVSLMLAGLGLVGWMSRRSKQRI